MKKGNTLKPKDLLLQQLTLHSLHTSPLKSSSLKFGPKRFLSSIPKYRREKHSDSADQ